MPAKVRVAVVGGGVAGTSVACRLCESAASDLITVDLFDQGSRGPGGRSSHRRVRRADKKVLPDDESFQDDEERSAHFSFDHGCQFFRADSPRFHKQVEELIHAGVVNEWTGRFGCVGGGSGPDVDFFGATTGDALYVGNGGMHRVARHLAARAEQAGARIHRGTRVSNMKRAARGWVLEGVGGKAALHDTAESVAAKAVHTRLGKKEAAGAADIDSDAKNSGNGKDDGNTDHDDEGFDVVVFSDASCSFESWHRASAGVSEACPELAAAVRSRARIPLFTAQVALEGTPGISLDGIVFGQQQQKQQKQECAVWFAARGPDQKCPRTSQQQSQQDADTGAAGRHECWTLVSTPAFAAAEIQATQMQDPETGAFRPQENRCEHTPAVCAL